MYRRPRFLHLLLALTPLCACAVTHNHASPSPATAFARGQVALHAQQYAQAVAWFERAVHLEARNAAYHLWLGRAYGHQARQASAGEQFFLARKVRRHLEQAVTLNPDSLAARLDLMEYYLQAPSLLGGSPEKAHQQAAEIGNRDAQQGALARQRCQEVETQGSWGVLTEVGE